MSARFVSALVEDINFLWGKSNYLGYTCDASTTGNGDLLSWHDCIVSIIFLRKV